MKPEHQVAASHVDTSCLRAAASSPRGARGSAGMKGGGGVVEDAAGPQCMQ